MQGMQLSREATASRANDAQPSNIGGVPLCQSHFPSIPLRTGILIFKGFLALFKSTSHTRLQNLPTAPQQHPHIKPPASTQTSTSTCTKTASRRASQNTRSPKKIPLAASKASSVSSRTCSDVSRMLKRHIHMHHRSSRTRFNRSSPRNR
jgi:hypothetical protein